MSTAAIIMMLVYLLVIWGGLAVGAFLMATHFDHNAGLLGDRQIDTSLDTAGLEDY